jgi:acid phosphatase (class A)
MRAIRRPVFGPIAAQFLALLLALVLAGGAPVLAQPQVEGYLTQAERQGVMAWLPKRPLDGSPADAADYANFWATRSIVTSARGAQAHADDVYDPRLVTPRLHDAAGVAIDPKTTPVTFALLSRTQDDVGKLIDVAKGPFDQGRLRPFVRFPAGEHCELTPNDIKFDLGGTSSYPSGHAAFSWLWAMVLAEAEPDRADAIMQWAWEFGESRVVCGFHYPSDVAGGRLAAAAIFAKLQSNPAYQRDVAAARAELARARGIAPARPDPLGAVKRRVKAILRR